MDTVCRIFSNWRATAILITVLLLSGCGFQLRTTTLLPDTFQSSSLGAFDKYSPLVRMMRHQLALQGITTVAASPNVPHLYLQSESFSQRTLSLYQNNRRAEYELTYRLNYSVTLPDQTATSLTTSVTRNFLDNPQTALAKAVERDLVENEMREQAVSQVMRQLARVNSVNNANAAEANQ